MSTDQLGIPRFGVAAPAGRPDLRFEWWARTSSLVRNCAFTSARGHKDDIGVEEVIPTRFLGPACSPR